MKSGQRNALLFLFALSAALLGILGVGYRQLPAPAVSVHVAVIFVEIDDGFMEEIGVKFKTPASMNGSSQ